MRSIRSIKKVFCGISRPFISSEMKKMTIFNGKVYASEFEWKQETSEKNFPSFRCATDSESSSAAVEKKREKFSRNLQIMLIILSCYLDSVRFLLCTILLRSSPLIFMFILRCFGLTTAKNFHSIYFPASFFVASTVDCHSTRSYHAKNICEIPRFVFWCP